MGKLSDYLGGGGGGSFEAVARGAISKKDTVTLNSDGSVSALTYEGMPIEFSSGSDFVAGAEIEDGVAVYDANSDCIIVVFSDGRGADFLYVAVGTIIGGVVTFGTATQIHASASYAVNVTYDPISERYLICFVASSMLYGRAMRVSAGVATFGTVVTISATYPDQVKVAYGGGSFLVVFKEVYAPQHGKAVAVTISGMAITIGTLSSTYTGTYILGIVQYSPTLDRFLVLFRGPSNLPYAMVIRVTGTSFTVTIPAAALAASAMYVSHLIYDPSRDRFIALVNVGGSYSFRFVDIGGSSVTWEGTTDGNAVSVPSKDLLLSTDNNYLISFCRISSGGAFRLHCQAVKINSSSFTANRTVLLDSVSEANNYHYCAAFVASLDRFFVIYPKSNAILPPSALVRPRTLITDVASHIGFASKDAADGAIVLVSTFGSVVDGFTGLIPGELYQMEYDGTPTLEITEYGPIGKAVSATKLLITDTGEGAQP